MLIGMNSHFKKLEDISLNLISFHKHFSNIDLWFVVKSLTENTIQFTFNIDSEYHFNQNSQTFKLENLVRKNELWKSTCFEFFLKSPISSEYWEFNFSLDGCYNQYHFADQRLGMEESDFFEIQKVCIESNQISIVMKWTQKDIWLMHPSAILKIDSLTDFYGIKHPCDKPDFHHPSNFCIEL